MLMMNSYRQNKGRGRNRFIVAAVLVLVVLLLDGITGGSMRSLVREAASVVWGVGSSVSESISGSGLFSTRKALEQENRTLRNELSQLQLRSAAFDALLEESESLRKLVSLAEEERGITAPVVSSFRSSPYGTFLIGAGVEDGVNSGSIVLIGDAQAGGFVVGYVEDAGRQTSLVKAVFAPGEETDAVIAGVSVSVNGRGRGQAQAEAPREAPIATGDIVFSARYGGKPIGVVGNIEREVGGASERVYIHVPVNLYEVRFVYVLPAQQ